MITTAFQKNAFQNKAFQIVLTLVRPRVGIKQPLVWRIRASSLRVMNIKPVKNRRVD